MRAPSLAIAAILVALTATCAAQGGPAISPVAQTPATDAQTEELGAVIEVPSFMEPPAVVFEVVPHGPDVLGAAVGTHLDHLVAQRIMAIDLTGVMDDHGHGAVGVLGEVVVRSVGEHRVHRRPVQGDPEEVGLDVGLFGQLSQVQHLLQVVGHHGSGYRLLVGVVAMPPHVVALGIDDHRGRW